MCIIRLYGTYCNFLPRGQEIVDDSKKVDNYEKNDKVSCDRQHF